MAIDDKLKKLGNIARTEQAPKVDVRDRVLAMIAEQGTLSDIRAQRQTMYVAAISSAAAAAMVVLGFQVYYTWADPVSALYNAISWVTQ